MYAIPVQAVADAQYNFLYMSARCSGSTHDSVAFAVSNVAQNLSATRLPHGYWIAADLLYTCLNWIITPWSPCALRGEMGIYRDAFNFFS